jgi:hypothetical protein
MPEVCTEIQQVMPASLLKLVSHLRDRLADQPVGRRANPSVCSSRP